MKNTLVFLLLIAGLSIKAQSPISLKIDNPEPRVGDVVQLSFSIAFLTDNVNEQVGVGIEVTNSGSNMGCGIRSSDLTKTIRFEKTGKHVIGPFKFEFNGSTYSTDSIEVNVLAKLPDAEGLWVRSIEADGKNYIILEQKIADSKLKSKAKNWTKSAKNKKPNLEFAELKESPTKGVILTMNQSTMTSGTPAGDVKQNPELTYFYQRYEVVLNNDYKGGFMLKLEYFVNLPKGFVLN